ALLSTEELEDILHVAHPKKERFLGYYSREGLEFALSHYGVWTMVQRLGYAKLRLELGQGSDGERVRLLGSCDGTEHSLIDLVLDRQKVNEQEYLYVNWLAMRNPRARFTEQRPP